MPFILVNGQLQEVTQAEFDAFNQATPDSIPAGGTILEVQAPLAQDRQEIIDPNTVNNNPGQVLPRIPTPLQLTPAAVALLNPTTPDDIAPVPQALPEPPDISPYGEEADEAELLESERVAVEEPEPLDDDISPYGEEQEIDAAEVAAAEAQALEEAAAVTADDFAAVGQFAGATPDDIAPLSPQEQAARAAAEGQARVQAQVNSLRSQATLQAQRRQANQGDWRIKLRLAESAQYLYLDPEIQQGSILWPLLETGGVIFPYTPSITVGYNANYTPFDLTHSNYRGYFYQNSHPGELNLQATFTAQDSTEADYLLAVIHFFRSVTKMFYGGKDPFRGSPPPLVFLQGLGEFQFNLQPCVVQSFTYNLPNDVDYIRARSPNNLGTNLQIRRQRDVLPTSPWSASSARLSSAGVNKGAELYSPAPPTLGRSSPTYVPTRIDITAVLLPMQSRQQQSQQFNMRQFANGELVKKGFW